MTKKTIRLKKYAGSYWLGERVVICAEFVEKTFGVEKHDIRAEISKSPFKGAKQFFINTVTRFYGKQADKLTDITYYAAREIVSDMFPRDGNIVVRVYLKIV